MAPTSTSTISTDTGIDYSRNKIGTLGCKAIPGRHPCTPHVIALVGLPMRGKTFISRKLTQYLKWIGYCTKLFNVGEYRSKELKGYESHEFFNPDNAECVEIRDRITKDAITDALDWLKQGGDVAVFDATNHTHERREMLYEAIVKKHKFKLFFVESICSSDKKILEIYTREMIKSSPDYKGMSADKVIKDLCARIGHFEQQYQPMDEKLDRLYSFMKVFDAGEKVVVFHQEGNLQSRVVYFLMNSKFVPRTIYLSRHGESEYNLAGRVGGDAGLSKRGLQYAQLLAEYFNNKHIENLEVWTSNLKRTSQTAQWIDAPERSIAPINELYAGTCDGLTYEEIQEIYPKEFSDRDKDKYGYRYPSGESYQDVVSRLEPALMELEREENILVISHQATLRCVLAYFLDIEKQSLPYMKVPLHTVLKMNLNSYGAVLELEKINVECVDTFREKPKTKMSVVTPQNCSSERSSEEALYTVPAHG